MDNTENSKVIDIDDILCSEINSLVNYLSLCVNTRKAPVDKIIINPHKNEHILFNKHCTEIYRIDTDDYKLLELLIMMAPKKIIINSINEFSDRELLKIIIAIFKERVGIYLN